MFSTDTSSWPTTRMVVGIILGLALVGYLTFAALSSSRSRPVARSARASHALGPEAGAGLTRAQQVKPGVGSMRIETLRARHALLTRQLRQQAPTGPYIIVDTARNRLVVRQRDNILLSALASTGSGTILDNPDRPGTRWVFDTPRGEYAIQSRLMNPVWVKPDWAFLEEGLEIPTDPADRVEAGMLGEYALGFGKGYFIHGTLYKRLLGKNVTHGCIRLNDEDLKMVYRLASVGTQVMIF